jgi:hypothetical protein
MRKRIVCSRTAAVAALSMICATGIGAATAQTSEDQNQSARLAPPVTVVVSGLQDPREISFSKGRLIVAESGSGKVLSINPKHPKRIRTLASGLGEGVSSGAIRIGKRTFILTGELGGPPDRLMPDTPIYPGSAVLVAKYNKRAKKIQVRKFADLLAFELAHNPDGQTQFGPDKAPLDALSNPFYVIKKRTRPGHGPKLLVADGGANDVLQVGRHGKVSVFFVPPTVNTGACAGVPNNDAKTVGCDAVPTGLAYGPNNRLYVSALTGEVPGEGRVYVLNAKTGKVKRVMTGFTSPTGVAVTPNGTVYVSEVLENSPEGEPAPDFDPATIGQIVKVQPNGKRSYAQVTMPTGLIWRNGNLYSSAWSIASFLGMSNAGQVVKVSNSAFTP